MDSNMIKGAMAAEDALFKKDSSWMDGVVDNLSDDDPVKDEATKHKSSIGDLALLPEGHPLRVELEEAKKRFEQNKAKDDSEDEELEKERAKIRKAKRIDEKESRRQARENQANEERRKRNAVEIYNGSIDEAVEAISRLENNIIASMEDLNDDMYTKMRMERLNRMVQAFERGLIESKLNTGRVVNG